MKKFVLEFPDTKSIIKELLSINQLHVEEILSPLVNAVSDTKYCLSQKRLHFIMELIFKRKELLEKALGI
jgi:hypothetical protein